MKRDKSPRPVRVLWCDRLGRFQRQWLLMSHTLPLIGQPYSSRSRTVIVRRRLWLDMNTVELHCELA